MTKQDFNGGYCLASQEAYDALVEYGIDSGGFSYQELTVDEHNLLFIYDDFINANTSIENLKKVYSIDKQFYIVDGKPTWDKPEEKEDESK